MSASRSPIPNLPATITVADIETMAPLTYKGQRVLTTELAAKAFETDDKLLRQNYDRNEPRFEEGKHFFRVVGAELKALKDSTSFRGSVGRKANALMLWTDRGIARHAKILETEVAWDIYERLEDRYFAPPDAKGREPAAPKGVSATELRRQHAYWLEIAERAIPDANAALFSANRMTRKATGVDVMAEMGVQLLPSPADEIVLPPTAFCQELGVARGEINPLITKHGYQTDHRDHRNRLYYVLTDKGREAGGRGLDREVEHSMGSTMRIELKWPHSLVERLRADIVAEAH